MQERTLIGDLASQEGRLVVITGRVVAARSMGGINFFDVIDRTGSCQVVLDAAMNMPRLQSVVHVLGRAVRDVRGGASVEVQAETLAVLSHPNGELPLDPSRLPSPGSGIALPIDKLLDHRVLSLRSQSAQAILRVTSETLKSTQDHFRSAGFIEVKTPKLVAGGTEGGADLFELRYFDRLAYLAQSPQLYKEILAATPIERVFEIGPAFRAERHATGRHLNEFVSIDAEMSYPRSMGDIMDCAEALLRSVIGHLQGACEDCFVALSADLPALREDSIPRLDLRAAKAIATGSSPSRLDPPIDLSPEEERRLCEWSRTEHGCDALFVHSFPLRSKPFYTKAKGHWTSESFDLLLRGLELSSGGLRLHTVSDLESAMDRHDLNECDFAAYSQMIRTGCPPHGGFGIGLERLVQKVLDLPNVRHACSFPRDRYRLEP